MNQRKIFYHIVLTKDFNKEEVYVNGTLTSLTFDNVNKKLSFPFNVSEVRKNKQCSISAQTSVDVLQDIAIFDKLLTQNEISILANSLMDQEKDIFLTSDEIKKLRNKCINKF